MERDEHEEVVDLGAVSTETRGLPMGDDDDIAGPRYRQAAGLSND